MASPRSVRRSLVFAVTTWLLSTVLIVATWAFLDADWGLAVPVLMAAAGIAAYVYVLARRGD